MALPFDHASLELYEVVDSSTILTGLRGILHTAVGTLAAELEKLDWSQAFEAYIEYRKNLLGLNSGIDLAAYLLGLAAQGGNLRSFTVGVIGQPDDNAVFRAFLVLRAAGLNNTRAAVLLRTAGLAINPNGVRLTVLSWSNERLNTERREFLYAHAALFGDNSAWVPA